MSNGYRRQNPYLGAIFFLVARKRYLDMAVSDGMASNLEAPDQKKLAQERGAEILQSWEAKYRTDYTEMTNKISQALWSSFWTMVIASAVSLLAAFYLQKIDFSFPFSPSKFATFTGSALVSWAALMELGGNFPVWDGGSFPQKVHTVIFKAIFIPGVLGVLVSITL